MTPRCAAVALFAALSAAAAEIALTEGDLRIAPGASRVLDFGTVPQDGHTVTLRFLARMDFPALSGSTLFLRVRLNGREVGGSRSRRAVRLVNRPLVSPVAPNLPASWCAEGHWRLVYAPDFESPARVPYYIGDPCEFVLDITDLVNPAAENRLEFISTADAHGGLFARGGGEIVMRRVAVRVDPVPSPTLALPDVVEVINRGEPGAGPAAYTGRLLPGGGFVLQAGGREWSFESAFSYPDAGLNRLVPGPEADRRGEAGWRVRAEPAEGGGRVAAAGAWYRVERTLRFTPRRAVIADTITNLQPEAPLGLLVRHDVDLEAHGQAQVRLAGNPDPGVDDEYAPANPSVHVAEGAFGLGILCEDTVFRNQARLSAGQKPCRAGIRTEMLWLPPAGSRTLEWSVYPVASADYYDFANLVREDWGANFTAEGPWTFFDPDAVLAAPLGTLSAQLARLGVRYACSWGGWVDRRRDPRRIGFGTGVMDPYWADYRERLRAAAQRLRAARPGIRVLLYYDTQRDTSEDGPERFRDSLLTDPRGDPVSTDWGGRYSLTYSMVATLDNSFGKAMLEVAARYLDELGADGLYWDEMECTGYGAPLVTFNRHDGCSCVLDPASWRVAHLAGVTTLLGESHRLAVIDLVRSRGGVILGNGPPCTRELLGRKVQRMVETQHNETWCYQGNLDTPLGYAGSRTDFGNWVRALNQATLLVGNRCDYGHEISPLAFPFTPMELHRGYLLGRERILTVHDGAYGWPREAPLVLAHRFDRDGRRLPGDWATRYRAGECRTEVTLAEGEAAVLERLPYTVSGAGEAEFRSLVRDPGALRGEVSGRGLVTLQAGSASVVLELGAESRPFVVALP